VRSPPRGDGDPAEPRDHDKTVTAHRVSIRATAPALARSLPGFRIQLVAQDDFVAKSETVRVGSHRSNDLVIAHPTVSRFHCELRPHTEGLLVRDLQSRNGTTVDGTRVVEAYVRDGAVLTLGEVSATVRTTSEDIAVPMAARTRFGALVGVSDEMRAVFSKLERLAATDATVLLIGETGTGKEAAAEAIHNSSGRADKPFVVVDCASLPANLIESELFGHEKGAFTGAHDARMGAVEAADGGTLFLDELGELPLDLQPRLLRVLEKRSVRRLGQNAYRSVDVRFVAATNRSLPLEVNTGRFRSDLFFRLATFTIELPPLRQRRDDIPLLVRDLLERMGAPAESIARILAPPTIERFMREPWPGNVRELRNRVEREVVLPSEAELALPAGTETFASARRRAIERFERGFLEEVLRVHGGHVATAARAIDLDRVHFYRLMRKHGLATGRS
jgi:two-component system response regulator GlrR